MPKQKQKVIIKPTKKFNVSIHFILDLNEFVNFRSSSDEDKAIEIVQEMIKSGVDWPEMEKIEIKTERIVRCDYVK